MYPGTMPKTGPSIPARRNQGPPVISPRLAQFKLPPPPRTISNTGEPPVDRQTIRGSAEDHTKKDAVETFVKDTATTVQQQQPQQPQQPQQQQQPQPSQQQPQQPQLRTRRFKVPPPIKCISESLDGGSRESYEMMTPAYTMSPNRQVSEHFSENQF